ncbi:MAG: hypothetical protein JXL97_16910 [Bacteroidales bacterium]|nr:hypothetical protein [Bacteroidales bacterium]
MKFSDIKFRIANSYIVSSISITLVLLTLGFFALLLFNTRDLSNGAKESITVTVILKPDVEKGDADALENKISAENFCKNARLVTPDEALEDLKMDLGDDITDVLDYNPLPTTINLNLNAKYSNTDSLEIIKMRLEQNEIVDDVFYNRSMVNQLDKNVRKITLVIGLLEFLLLIMAISLINNTIRLMVHSKRFEIKTMQLVGATAFFITKPFLIRSLIHGLFSSLISIAIIIASILYYQNSVDDIVKISHIEAVFGLILLAGVALTSLSTFISVNGYLNSKSEELY